MPEGGPSDKAVRDGSEHHPARDEEKAHYRRRGHQFTSSARLTEARVRLRPFMSRIRSPTRIVFSDAAAEVGRVEKRR
jgi:hypothetical protein